MTDQSLNLPIDFAQPAKTAGARHGLSGLARVDRARWEKLCADRVEGNGLFDPGFSLPAFDLVGGGKALLGHAAAGNRLVGLLPVVSARRLWKLPLPVLVARQPYSVLSTPLLDAADPLGAANALLDAARDAGASVLVIPDLPLEGPAAAALRQSLCRYGAAPITQNVRRRAALDATVDAESYLRAGMGARKLKELRRQGHRMADEGEVRFVEATAPAEIAAAIDRFLALEASGWKGRRGTGLGQDAADANFFRTAARNLSARGLFSVLELWLGQNLIAAGTVIRQGDQALFFKIAFDEAFSRFSPGVQLTVELTRRLCADETIRVADSTADEGHPMIDHVWRERLVVGDVYLPTGRQHPAIARALIKLALARQKLRERAKSFYHQIISFREERP